MRIASLGSGSKGNSTVIEGDSGRLLLDLGFGIKETVRRLARLGLTPLDIDALVVTHEHADHINGVAPFARKFRLPVYMTAGTYEPNRIGVVPVLRSIRDGEVFQVGSLTVMPVVVPHDAREPCQYVFSEASQQIGVLTDLGHITPHVRQYFNQCDILLLECNYDPGMLASGPYPQALKRRVGGNLGHLSNHQASELVKNVDLDRLQHLVVSHISEKNNLPALAEAALAPALQSWSGQVTVATQAAGFDWLSTS